MFRSRQNAEQWMRQINQDELVDLIQGAVQAWPTTIVARLRHHDPRERLRARLAGAKIVAARLQRLEILSAAPPPPDYNYADLNGSSGVPPLPDMP